MTDRAELQPPLPEPPPSIQGLFLPVREPAKRQAMERKIQKLHGLMRKHVWKALRMYSDAVWLQGRPWPGWDTFERELALQFATLLLFLRGLPRESSRLRLLDLFLDALNLENKRGRARKAKEKLASYMHGQRMSELWDGELSGELQAAWNMKVSLERAGAEPEARLRRNFPDDVVSAVLSRKATPESSLAKVYSHRNPVSEGRARNALREYQKLSGKRFAPQVC